jgi:hypothetical protein
MKMVVKEKINDMKKTALLILVSGITLFACKKPEVVPEPVPTSNLSALFENRMEDAKQSFTLDNTTGGTFEGSNGVIISVPANAFVYADGSAVSGSVSFELVEILTYREMMLLKKPTTSDGQILVSGGQINLTASKSGNPVYLASGMSVGVSVPNDSPDPAMRLFSGVEGEDGIVEWSILEDDSIIFVDDTAEFGGYYFEFDNPDLGWINCDYFWDNPNPITNATVTLPEEFTGVYATGFACFPEINSVMYMNWVYDSSNYIAYNIPVGTPTKFLFIAEIDGVYYSVITEIIAITADHVEVLSMSVTTLEAFEEAVAEL